jgi:N-acetyl-anhydromuramyl-L-alanine amidase AmpD
VSALDGVSDVNDFAIGVCLSNRNDGETYPKAQLFEAAMVCVQLVNHYGIPLERIVTHAEVALPPGRKTDPLGLDLEAFRATVRALLNGRR